MQVKVQVQCSPPLSIYIYWLVFSIWITVRGLVAFNEYYLVSRVAFNEVRAPCPRISVPRWCSFPVCCTYYVTDRSHQDQGLSDLRPLIGQNLSSLASHWSIFVPGVTAWSGRGCDI